MNVIDEFFPTKKLCGDLKPPLFRRISGRYITDFRCLSKNDQNVINYDTVDDIPMYQDKKCKCKGINLFDVSKNEVSTAFLVKKRISSSCHKSHTKFLKVQINKCRLTPW